MSGVDDRVVIVTGGAGAEGGLGLTTTEALAKAGATVIVWDHDPAAIDAARLELDAAGLAPEFVELDVSDRRAVETAYANILKRHDRVDGLVNNAAQKMAAVRGRKEDGSRGPAEFWELDGAAVLRLLEVNVVGPLITSAVVAPRMIAAGRGSIVNVVTSPHTKISPKHIPYGPSKAALEAMTIAMAAQLQGTGVRANCVLPGRSANRRGQYYPEDAPFDCMVAPILWLLGDASATTSGEVFAGTEFAAR